ncbi:MAG: PAS domain S-box protein [Gemmatimonadota bacterium]
MSRDAEVEALQRRLEEAEETIRAIQQGTVDAFVVEEPTGQRVYTLQGADRPYRLLVEQMQQGAATLQADGTIVYCNQSLADLLKVPHEKLLGAALHDYFAPDDRQQYENLLWQGLTRIGRGEARLRRSDGSLVPVYMTFNVLPADCGAITGVLVTDLTSQRHHEQLSAAHHALRESEERFRLMANAVPVLIWVSDTTKACTWFNQSWLDFSGRRIEELRGDGWASDVHEADLERCLNTYFTHFDARLPFSMEYRLRRHDSEYRWVLDNGVPRFDADGEFAGYIGSCVDFTDRKHAEEGLQEADRRKDEFLATLAHELRGPLAPLRNMLEIMKRSEGNHAVMHHARETMERQLVQMVRLVDDLLEVSRISHGRIDLKRELVELSTVLHQAVEACPQPEGAAPTIEVTLPPEPIYLSADPARLAQVFGNLLNNDCKYTEPGGRVWVTAARRGSEVVVRVRDTGVGIPPEKLGSVFDLFAQVDRSLERSQGGLGIGLTLVKRLVEMHGGSVAAFSEGSERGSEFVVRLPVLPGTPAVLPIAPSAVPEPPATARRILIADDNADSAASLAMLLAISGNQTHTACDGLEAVEVAERIRPDVVLLDIGMPRLNGYAACRRIREQPWGHRMIVVALTGWGQEADRQKSREAGFDHHLVKPVDYPELMRLLALRPLGRETNSRAAH